MREFIHNLHNKYYVFIIFAVGILMVLFPGNLSHIMIWALGGVMILRGILNMILCLRSREPDHGPGKAILYTIMGLVIMFIGRESINIIGVMWAVFTLVEVSGEIDEMWKEKHWRASRLFLAAFTVSLAVTLMIDPFEHFDAHVRVLGLVIISSSIAKCIEVIRAWIRIRREQA